MGSLYTWIAFYTDEVKDFLDRLADVEDEEGNKQKVFCCPDNDNDNVIMLLKFHIVVSF